MQLELKIDLFNSQLNRQDMDWLIYIWHMSAESYGMEAIIDKDKVPTKLKETMVFSNLFERLIYYRDKENLIEDFEEREDNRVYYILLSTGFLDAINRHIRIEFSEYSLLEPYRKKAIMNNSISISNFNGNLAIQQGNKNSKQENDFLSYENCVELKEILDTLLVTIDENVEVSNDIFDEISEIRSSITEINGMLKETSIPKGKIKSVIDNVLSRLVTIANACKLLQPIISELQEWLSNIL